jgi:UDP-N-acetylglucosamine--N-acetylmuramyl-(pentapeptide) pyrophosphoryl-undecaprenol N-acetylglucosamine transferase
MTVKRHFVMAAGGTGGHMVPAHALAEELMERGHTVSLITDDRGSKIPGLFKGMEVNVLPAGRLSGGIFGWLKAGRNILAGRRQAGSLYRKVKPAAVIGFGGYPALPALLAASGSGIATIIHEQNAVLGRVNRLLARKVDAIATAYPKIGRLPSNCAGKVELVGNPVRDEVLALRDKPFPGVNEKLNILVTGGSQGATILSSVVPDGLALLSEPWRGRLRIVQQCRAEDLDRVRARYAELGIEAELATYLADMPERLATAHIVIARAGASTIAELTAAGRPAILVPLPSATDDHQTSNAREMAREGGARSIAQAEFTPERLAHEIEALSLDNLAETAAHARACGRPDATRALADLVERIARTPGMDPLPAATQPVQVPAQGALA